MSLKSECGRIRYKIWQLENGVSISSKIERDHSNMKEADYYMKRNKIREMIDRQMIIDRGKNEKELSNYKKVRVIGKRRSESQ